VSFFSSDDLLSPSEESAFLLVARERSVRFFSRVFLLLCAFVVVWWPVDVYLFEKKATFWMVSGWRLGFLAIGLPGVYLLRWTHRAFFVHVLVQLTLMSIWVGCFLPYLPSSGPFPPLGLALPTGSVFLLLPFRQRLVATLVLATVVPTTYFLVGPHPVTAERVSYYASLMFVTVGLSLYFGHSYYRLFRADYFKEQSLSIVNQQLHTINQQLVSQANEDTVTLHQVAQLASQAQDSERETIAQELHDELGQWLTGMRFEVDMAKMLPGAAESPIQDSLHDLDYMLEQALLTLRQVLTGLRPTIVTQSGFAAACRWLVQHVQQRGGISCSLTLPGEDLPFDEERSILLFRILQEALTNILKHAHAKTVVVSLEEVPEGYRLLIQDDGVGCDEGLLHRTHGLGVLGIKQRTASLGGVCKLTSRPGEGMCIVVLVPFVKEQSNEEA
jgi:signal transduction histidine kinase